MTHSCSSLYKRLLHCGWAAATAPKTQALKPPRQFISSAHCISELYVGMPLRCMDSSPSTGGFEACGFCVDGPSELRCSSERRQCCGLHGLCGSSLGSLRIALQLTWPWWGTCLPSQLCGWQPLPSRDLYCRACCAPGRACMLPYWCVLTALEWAVKTSVDFCLPVAAYIKIACVSLPHALTRLAFCMTSGLAFNLCDHLCHSLCKTFSDPVSIG